MNKNLRQLFCSCDKSVVSAVTFGLFLSLGAGVIFKLNEAQEKAVQAHDVQVANSYANALEKVVEHALSSTHALAVLVRQGNGQVKDFSSLAAYILPMYKGAFALSLAPQGVIRQIEPAVSNTLLKDHDLFEGQDREVALERLREGDLRFEGPIKLIQGPQGAIGLLPVFLENIDGKRYFWGCTVVTLKFPDALSDANLSSLEGQGYAYRLSGMNVETHQEEVIQSSAAPLGAVVQNVNVRISGALWQLSISRTAHWVNKSSTFFEFFLVLSGSALMAWLAFSVSTLAQQRKQLHDIAMYDPLTELPNRRLLDIRLTQAIHNALNHDEKIAVCYLDLDGFKSVNDSLGHAAGDVLLKEASTRLQSCLRADDILARIGGDEFVVVLINVRTLQEASTVLERIISAIGQPFYLFGQQKSISASVGVAVLNSGVERAEQLLRAADQTMYLAKKTGKNKFLYAEEYTACSAAPMQKPA
ncbi:sensor domain-containing diguanylate cyclase [Pseudomonas sp. TH49]|uniref:sensor domain-containing diguanylate cyclase n=1 Tax=Pseudomonas sp. TH49 TaxID=2796413 RepID=UPI001914B3E4|nr:sensor domain-containing diguanylate cyclase [Pseudomonas sp. TH49]MBK5344712.1 sensor domain-containing diguanylate cyclase [Pseudomonas sp. TH49]